MPQDSAGGPARVGCQHGTIGSRTGGASQDGTHLERVIRRNGPSGRVARSLKYHQEVPPEPGTAWRVRGDSRWRQQAMISQSLTDALNDQLKQELYSSYLYLSMSAFCDDQSLTGFAHWLRLQADEEREHAMKVFDFLQDREAQAVLQAIPQPPRDFGSPLALFEQVLAHEQEVT